MRTSCSLSPLEGFGGCFLKHYPNGDRCQAGLYEKLLERFRRSRSTEFIGAEEPLTRIFEPDKKVGDESVRSRRRLNWGCGPA